MHDFPGRGMQGARTGRRRSQTGISLIQMVTVLAMLTLLTGAVLKVKSILTYAKARALSREMHDVKFMLYEYRSRYGVIPGDDATASSHLPGATNADSSVEDNNLIDTSSRSWASQRPGQRASDESGLFWQHVRLAGLAAGDPNEPRTYNLVHGRLGITSQASMTPVRPSGTRGNFVVCSAMIPGALARMIDIESDDGDGTAGNVWGAAERDAEAVDTAVAPSAYQDTDTYTVCMAF